MTDDLYTLQPRRIVMYAVDWCPDCRRAKFFFERKHIPYELVNVDDDQQGAIFVKQVNHGHRSVPTIIFPDGSIMVEPSTEQLAAKFSMS
ncbi:MAG TPA: glutaredoxin domain-containing protein [Anaerolineales bacterium]